MFFKSNMIVFKLFVVLLITKGSYGGDITCYICDDCETVNASTKVEVCNEDYFSSEGSTLSSVMTTEEPTTASPEDEIVTTTMDTTTMDDMMTPETTEDLTDVETTTMEIISAETPSMATPSEIPPTVPPVTPPAPRAALPSVTPAAIPSTLSPETPANVATAPSVHVSLVSGNDTVATSPEDATNSTVLKSYKPSSSFRVRDTRSLRLTRALAQDMQISYHCYTLKQTVNGKQKTSRGCSKVTADQAVCTQVTQNLENAKCKSCTMPRCNGSSALGGSVAALLFAVLAFFVRSN